MIMTLKEFRQSETARYMPQSAASVILGWLVRRRLAEAVKMLHQGRLRTVYIISDTVAEAIEKG